jgi:hypothetical protein
LARRGTPKQILCHYARYYATMYEARISTVDQINLVYKVYFKHYNMPQIHSLTVVCKILLMQKLQWYETSA